MKMIENTNLLDASNAAKINDRFQFHQYFIVLFCSYRAIKELMITAVLFCKTGTVRCIRAVVSAVISLYPAHTSASEIYNCSK